MIDEHPFISQQTFEAILLDKQVTTPVDIEVLQTIYKLDGHKGSATEIAKLLSLKDKVDLNGRIARFGKRIVKKFGINPRIRENGKIAYWDIPFNGYDEGTSFIWQLKPEMINAIEKLSLFDTNLATKQNAFLFVWNPNKWNWNTLDEKIELMQKGNSAIEKWSCTSHKQVKIGDRAFLAIAGIEPRGIFASGFIVSEPFLSKHWSGTDKEVYRVLIEFDTLINPLNDSILTLDKLNNKKLLNQQWTPQSSGISIKHEIIDELESIWFKFLSENNYLVQLTEKSNDDFQNTFSEGKVNQIIQTRYERNPFARKACLVHYGYSCTVCSFNFEEQYGEIGKKYIHVHHLNQISNIGKAYEIDPIKDLRPVCPNCHSMLHRKNPALTIEVLISKLSR